MIEVEAKARIDDVEAFRQKAKTRGRFVGKEKKVDDYYTLECLDHYPQKSLRIRKRLGHYEINFKHRLFYDRGIHVKREVEFVVKDIKGFLTLISDFGFKKWLRKEKRTELYELKKNFHIELNMVEGLGWFVEVEYLCSAQEVQKAKKEVVNIIGLLGIPRKDWIGEGYTKLLWDKRR